jgi:hypothetical protein
MCTPAASSIIGRGIDIGGTVFEHPSMISLVDAAEHVLNASAGPLLTV